METYTYEEWVDKYKPITNPFFPEAEYNGTFFHPQNLGQITAFLQTQRLWTLIQKSRIVNKDTGETLKYKEIEPGYKVLDHIGFFITTEPFESLAIQVSVDI